MISSIRALAQCWQMVDQRPLEDVRIKYQRGTKPPGELPFHVKVRRIYWWWPGSERHGKFVDRCLLLFLLAPFLWGATFVIGWKAVLLIAVELILIYATIWRAVDGRILD